MPIIDELADLPKRFASFCEGRGIVFEPDVRRDMLACTLGSQMLLFAGPSGTGKSTAAKVLADFFTPSAAVRSLDVRPLWTGPDGATGYWSPLTDSYEKAEGLSALVDLDRSDKGDIPFLIIEEANLSPPEVYLGAVITALSGLAAESVTWGLHLASDAGNDGTLPPATVVLTPYPRFLATINVDSTSSAPSPKVCGRALTVLLEPPSVELACDSTGAINAADHDSFPPPEASVLDDPRAAWAALVAGGQTETIKKPIRALCTVLEAELQANVVSPRDLQRAVMFMAWYVALAEHEDNVDLDVARADAAELALLHAVLPGLGSGHFETAVKALEHDAREDGLLASRLHRVRASATGVYGVPPDFWSALS